MTSNYIKKTIVPGHLVYYKILNQRVRSNVFVTGGMHIEASHT